MKRSISMFLAFFMIASFVFPMAPNAVAVELDSFEIQQTDGQIPNDEMQSSVQYTKIYNADDLNNIRNNYISIPYQPSLRSNGNICSKLSKWNL